MSARAPICVQIAALGGQGGGVLAEWLAEAAHHGGYPAQVTSIPGVAQRTGATTYYFEMYPEKNTTEKPLFCLFPDADGLDLMIAMEPLEAVRALDLGLITERTIVLTVKNRIYSMAEKSVAGDGSIDVKILYDALEGAAKRVVCLDIESLSAKPGAPGNAVMFGAVAACGILPLSEENYHQAIHTKGIAVDPSLADFATGFNHSRQVGGVGSESEILKFDDAPDVLDKKIEALPAPLQALVGHACASLIDYQDESYAQHFLDRFQPFVNTPSELALEVARRLGAWMRYEDVIRVAQLKTRPGRLARIRGEIGVDEMAPLTVTEFLKPGREEFASLMPPVIGKLVMKGHRSSSTSGLRLRLPTTTFFGYGALKILARLRRWRRRTYRYECEQKVIERWLGAVEVAVEIEPELALRTAQLAILARGYGGVRARGLERLESLFLDWDQKLKDAPESLSAEVDKILNQAHHDPDRDCGKTNQVLQ